MSQYIDELGERQLGRDRVNARLGGVCAGVGHYLDVPSLFVRVGAILGLLVAAEATLIAYGLAFFILDDLDDE